MNKSAAASVYFKERQNIYESYSIWRIMNLSPHKPSSTYPKTQKYRTMKRKNRHLQHITDEWAESLLDYRKFLEYPTNWDERGSEEFQQPAWDYTVFFIEENFRPFFHWIKTTEELPEIEPGAMGNFFVNWETEQFRVLAKIPKNKNEVGEYYADNYHGTSVSKDILRPRTREISLVTWISKQLDQA